jgi:hypothetical protein
MKELDKKKEERRKKKAKKESCMQDEQCGRVILHDTRTLGHSDRGE